MKSAWMNTNSHFQPELSCQPQKDFSLVFPVKAVKLSPCL